jgi:uncharacterized protein YndB with AHSA1/START domain
MMAEDRDLVLARTLDAPLELVWRVWTTPEHIKLWWAPKPYETPEVEVDWRPGGVFRFVMTGPDGFREDGAGCVLEFVPKERIVWTSALGPGWRPAAIDAASDGCDSFPFTAIVTFADAGGGRTLYKAVALHKDRADRDRHEKMGFHEGWGTVAGQLEQVAAGLAERV